MSENDARVQVATYLRKNDDLYQFIVDKARERGVSVSDVVRMALLDQMQVELVAIRTRTPEPGTITP